MEQPWRHLALLWIALIVVIPEGNCLEMEVYTQMVDLGKFLYQENLPAMNELTVCLWVKERAVVDDGLILGLATSASHNNLLIYPKPALNQVVINMRNSLQTFTMTYDRTSNLTTDWNQHCYTWRVSGEFKYFSDLDSPGTLKLIVSHQVNTVTIVAGGTITLLRDQDSMLGGFDLGSIKDCDIAGFNMWDYEMTEDEIKSIGCGGWGNVINWDTLQEMGYEERHLEVIPCVDPIMGSLFKTYENSEVAMTTLDNAVVRRPLQCMALCDEKKSCVSVNYHLTSGVCQLGTMTESIQTLEPVSGVTHYSKVKHSLS